MLFIIDILIFEKEVFRIVGKTNMDKRLLKRGTSFYMIGNIFKNFFLFLQPFDGWDML